MVKDKKKKQDKKEKKKKKASQQPKEVRTYFPEALLEYQIQIKEDVIDQLLLEIKRLEDINERCHERNQNLKAEQTGHLRALLTTLKEQEKELEKLEVVTRDDVEKAMKDKWQYIKDQEKLIKDMRSQINQFEQKLLVKQAEVDYWLEYKNVGSADHAQQIQTLEQDIKKLKEDLEEMIEYFRLALEETKQKIDKYTLKQMELKKEWATENAVKHIDSISCREIKEYEWLKEEVALYRKEVDEMEATAHALEEENIYLIKKLYDRRLHYLRVPRKLFLTQGAGLQIPGEELENVESKTSGQGASFQVSSLLYPKVKEVKETAAITPSYEMDSLASTSEIIFATDLDQEGEEGEGQSEDPSELVYLRGQTASQFLPPLLYEDTGDFKEYTDLGPLEVKLMSMVGRAVPLHEDIKEMPSRTQLEERFDSSRAFQRITYQMIKSVFP
ncbi:PREDICTED: coiled-coil domain-containing protein 83 [Gekko japonicus]|uniref:Coiled-coil domain-containing protein 83 n=1 Tax=Gekko japonicus TaxID=146911 RepID=A0ABM1LB79_GEKJA|nr:PREDICTED: coiled-coil domain-containing protein 83 [Gekko japonicus]